MLFFSEEAGYISFLNLENRDKQYYKDAPLSPGMVIVLKSGGELQCCSNTIKNLYYKAKAYELLSLYFNRAGRARCGAMSFFK